MPYVDGFVIPVSDLAAYRNMARAAGQIWMDYGALAFHECVGDDLDGPMPFTRFHKLKPGEALVFSWIVFKSRAHRDKVNAKVMQDPRMAKMPQKVPFDMKRMSYGGFKSLVDYG